MPRRRSRIAAVTVHYNVAVRLGAAVRAVAEETGIVFSPWHPGTVPGGDDGAHSTPSSTRSPRTHDATAHQVALAWQLQRAPNALPIPGTTSVQHLQANLPPRASSLPTRKSLRSPH